MKEGNNGNSNNSEKKKVEGAHRIVNVHKSQIGKLQNSQCQSNGEAGKQDDERANPKKKSIKTQKQGGG